MQKQEKKKEWVVCLLGKQVHIDKINSFLVVVIANHAASETNSNNKEVLKVVILPMVYHWSEFLILSWVILR